MPVLFVILHLLLCLIAYLCMRGGFLKSSGMITPLIVLVPVWGFCALLFLEIHTRGKEKEGIETGVEKLVVEDEVRRSISMAENHFSGNVAPLNEILTVNDPGVRRKVIMEVLYDNPADYVRQLQAAKNNDDTEVVHYAVTALIELQKDYTWKIQRAEAMLEKDPENFQLQREYRKLLEDYLNSGLLEGSNLVFYRIRYSEMLEKELKVRERASLYAKKAEVDMQLGEYERSRHSAERLITLWPDRETGYLKMIEYYTARKEYSGISEMIRILKKRQIYLSPDGRKALAFWENKEPHSNAISKKEDTGNTTEEK